MRNVHSTENAGGKAAKSKQAKKGADPAYRFGRPDRRAAALSQGARPNARRLPTRNMNRGR